MQDWRRVLATTAGMTCVGVNAAAQCDPVWNRYSGDDLDRGPWVLTTWDSDGAGPHLPIVVAGGLVGSVGPPNSRVAVLDERGWRSIGKGVEGDPLCALTGSTTGPLSLLGKPILGGMIPGSVRYFTGASWQPVGGGMTIGSSVYSMVEFNSELIVGGTFWEAGGIIRAGIARFDGKSWRPFPDERAGGAESLIVHKGELYAGGSWWARGSNGAKTNDALTGILRWTGQEWVNVGTNYPSDSVYALASYRDRLYAGGYFNGSTQPGNYIASFDGTSWQSVGGGTAGTVLTMRPFDLDGPGPMPELLIIGGSFSMAGLVPANRIAAWDGIQWSAMGSGASSTVRALTEWKGRLVVGGEFHMAGGIVSPGLAFWSCPLAAPCFANCDASAIAPVLNVADFICFLTRFAAGDPGADCDGFLTPPTLNIADFVCFLNRFAAGCP